MLTSLLEDEMVQAGAEVEKRISQHELEAPKRPLRPLAMVSSGRAHGCHIYALTLPVGDVERAAGAGEIHIVHHKPGVRRRLCL